MCCPADEFGITDEYSSDAITSRNNILSNITTLLSKIAGLIEAVLTELAGLPEHPCTLTMPSGVFGKGSLQQSSIFDLGQIKVSQLKHFIPSLPPSLMT